MLEVTLALATLIRGGEIHSLDDEFPLALHFTMIAGGPIRARVRPRLSATVCDGVPLGPFLPPVLRLVPRSAR